jgi:hypothetical protein
MPGFGDVFRRCAGIAGWVIELRRIRREQWIFIAGVLGERWAWGEKLVKLNPRGSTSTPSSSPRGYSIHAIPSSSRIPAFAARNQLRGLMALSRRELRGVLGLDVCAPVIRNGLAAFPRLPVGSHVCTQAQRILPKAGPRGCTGLEAVLAGTREATEERLRGLIRVSCLTDYSCEQA